MRGADYDVGIRETPAPPLTKPQASLLRLLSVFDSRSIVRKQAKKLGMQVDFDRCTKAGLIVSANFETSGKADDWLNSIEGRAALLGTLADAHSKSPFRPAMPKEEDTHG